MKFINVLTHFIDSLNEWVGRIVAWLIVPAVMVVVIDVISRKFFSKAFPWGYDLSLQCIGFFFMMGMGFTLLKKGHVNVDFISQRFSNKTDAVMNILLYALLVFPMLLIFTKVGMDYAIRSWVIKERIGITSWNPIIYPFKTAIPVGFILLSIQAISEILKNIMRLIGRSEG